MISNRLGLTMSGEYEFKQALVVRLDLKIGRGKIAVQCSHAAVSAAEEARTRVPDWWKTWIADGQPKIALKVPDLDAILLLEQQARAKRFPFSVVKDKGLTQVPPGTITCIGIGPAPVSLLDGLTGNLPLL
jgi:peptidyl-tRNA hydrolase, PTH2 family